MSSAAKEGWALELRLFGTFDVRVHGQPLPPLRYRKEQWLLALLALRQDRDVARNWLAATFWPDNEESQALFYLRKSLSHLRNALGQEAHRLQSPTSRTVRLDLSDAFCDVQFFDTAVKAHPSTTEEVAEARLMEAIPLYRGPLLQDCLEEWVTPEREAREQSYLSALEMLAEYTLARGETAAASRWLRLALAAEPYRESAACSLMQALADSGDRAAMQQVYRDLRSRLQDGLNTSPAPETESLYKRLSQKLSQPEVSSSTPASSSAPYSGLAPAAPPAPSLRHLPVPLTDLIGRETEIAEVGVGLERSRLVTLLGAGGVGKTRLSIAAAESVLPRFSEGVWFVDLAALTEGAYVPEAVARVLGVQTEAERSTEECLIASLKGRSLLLVLDNCEHLIDACATLAHHLLSACPGVRMLATSRQALGVTGEQVYPVPSLALPAWEEGEGEGKPSHLLGIEKNTSFLREYAGIELFVQRAVQANPAFRLDRRNAEAVVAVCHQLDGIPLAIEMAAARVRSLSVGDIQNRLSDRFRLLTSGSRSALPRQQTLRALIDWSYSLLSDSEKALLRRLSVFAGGWTLDAAEKVCVGDGVEDWEVLDILTALVEKSLVVYEQRGEEARYRLLETIRQYASDRLRETEDIAVFRRQHYDYFLALTTENDPKLMGAEAAYWQERLEAERDNLRQAFAFCEESAEGAQLGLRLMSTLSSFWLGQERMKEGGQRCATFLAHEENAAPTPERATVLLLAGNIAYCQGNNPSAQQHFEEALAVRKHLGDRRGLAAALGSLGNVTHIQGDYARARELFEEALAISREMGAKRWEATSLACLGNVAFDQKDYAASRAYKEAALEISRQTGNRYTESHTLAGLGNTALRQSAPADAIRFYEQALAIDREMGNTSHEANTLGNLAISYAAFGDIVKAGTLYCQALSLMHEGGDQRVVAGTTEAVAKFLSERGPDYLEPACRLLGAAENLREEIGSRRPPGEQESYDDALARIRQDLAEETIAAAWVEGRATPIDKAIAFAIRQVSTVSENYSMPQKLAAGQ